MLSTIGTVLFIATYFSSCKALKTWSAGGAISVNTGANNTQFAYTFPRQLGRSGTIEWWARGQSNRQNYAFQLSVSHPKDDNLITVGDTIYLMGLQTMKEIPSGYGCPGTEWCHIALTWDTSAYPRYEMKFYRVCTSLKSHDPPSWYLECSLVV